MEILNRHMSLDRFFSRLTGAADRVLMLDYDGTLAPFHEKRDKAFPYPGVEERLTKLIDSGTTRLIIVSGRAVEALIPLLRLEILPEIRGCHGAEGHIPGKGFSKAELPRQTTYGLRKAEKWAASENLSRYLETKPTGLAFHWRGVPNDQAASIRERIETAWLENSIKSGLMLHEFDGGMELRAIGITKGEAVSSTLNELPNGAVMAYLGDDLTDEDAFQALKGRGLRVLVRAEKRPTEADLWIRPPDELLSFLDRWLEAVS